MTEFKLRVNPKQRTTYVPRKIVDGFGYTIVLVPGYRAGIFYPEGETPRHVLETLEVIIADLKLREVRAGGSA